MNEAERRILRQVWIKAAKEGVVTIALPDAGQAKHLRLRLYKVAAKARKDATADTELALAADQCSIRVDGGSVIVETLGLQANSLIGAVSRAIEYDPKVEDGRKAAELLERFGKAGPGKVPEAPPSVGRSTKYFTRDEG